jgi:hypothetical protein
MPDSKDAGRRICKMLDMSDEELLAEFNRYFLLSDEHHQRISSALEEMMLEVDCLISRMDEIDYEQLKIEDEEPEFKVNFLGQST